MAVCLLVWMLNYDPARSEHSTRLNANVMALSK